MRPSLMRIDVITERINIRHIAIIVLNRYLNLNILFFTFDINDFRMNWGFILIDKTDIFLDSTFIKISELRRIMTLIHKINLDAFI